MIFKKHTGHTEKFQNLELNYVLLVFPNCTQKNYLKKVCYFSDFQYVLQNAFIIFQYEDIEPLVSTIFC